MKTINVDARPFVKTITVPTSKSYATRLLILGALKYGEVKIRNLSSSTDVINLLSCLKEVGIATEDYVDGITILNDFPRCEHLVSQEFITLNTGDGGTTNRFLLAMLALGHKEYHLIPDSQIMSRPFDELLSALHFLGAKVEVLPNGWKIQGPISLKGNAFEIDCSQTTQFASALEMLSLTEESFKVATKNLHASAKYFDLTKKLIHKIQNENDFEVPLDFSSLGYPLALALLDGEVNVSNCTFHDTFQPDSALLQIIKKIGGDYTIDESGLNLKKCKKIHGIDIDCSEHPDLVPTLAFILSYAHSESRLTGLGELRFKETDRIVNIIKVLESFNVPHSFDEMKNELYLEGNAPTSGRIEFDCPHDHRIIMMAYLFMRVNNGGVLNNVEYVNKSFPDFFATME